MALIDGSLLTHKEVRHQLPYILLISLLAFLYIANQHHAEKLAIETVTLQKEIKELRTESISLSSELLYISNQVEIAKLLQAKGLDLEESVTPPVRIVVNEKETRPEHVD